MHTVTAGGCHLEYMRLHSAHPRDGAPAIVFLHEGLGSLAMWRDFPQRIADATGCEAIVYSRAGYGRSDPATLPRTVRYMHDEGLEVLPELLAALELDRPILFGHSDGGSIALICAGGTATPLSGLILMAPHVMVEDISVSSIAQAQVAWVNTDLPARLGKYHADVNAAFRGWNDIWLHPDFRAWNIEEYLGAIRCPVLAIQGEDDEYGTMAQIDRIAAQVADVDLVRLADCRHSPHKDQPEAVIEAVSAFVARLLDNPGLRMKFERNKLIRFHHCDPAGIVFYPQYLVLCNEVVEDWFDQGIGVNFFTLHAELKRGVPMRHMEVDFLAPSMHGDELTFSLQVEKIGGTSIGLLISAGRDGVERFRTRQTVVWADLEGAPRAIAIEDEWRERFERYLKD
jgi:pimeloyl-ACP methyl ester carboxylesterase/acyl-CoA thioesterase FadM